MNAQATLRAVQAAVAADVPLTLDEEQGLRAWTQDTTADLEVVLVRGSLKELADIVARQSNARMAQMRADAINEAGRVRAGKLAERERKWQELPHLTAAAFLTAAETRDPAWQIFLGHLQNAEREAAPRSFDPTSCLTQTERDFG